MCRVHIALHGCKQDASDIGATYVEDTGYNAWADTNHIIVLYPETVAQPILTFPSPNPEACWDWWSYVTHSEDYVSKTGRQIQAIKAMLDTLTVGQKPQAPLPAAPGVAPSTLIVTDTSDQAAALAWIPIVGAEAYHISLANESGDFTQIGTVVGPSFGDAGLKPSTTYRYRVTAIVGGVESAPSPVVRATTLPTPAPCDAPGSCPVSASKE